MELLVVLAILGLLAAIVLPAMKQTEVSAKQAACASNMRQLGMALLAYASDHQNRLPQTTHTSEGVEDAWIALLSDYLDNVDRVRVSPAEPAQRKQDIIRRRGTSYILNDLVFAMSEQGTLLTSLRSPSRTIFAFVGSESRRPGPMNDHTHAGSWTSWPAMFGDVEVDRHRPGARSGSRTEGSSNYLYGDGRVEAHSAREMKSRLDRGENPAVPPQS